MIAYLDSSVILRVVLRQPEALAEWNGIVTGITSALAEVECLRTMDRLRLLGQLTADEAVAGRETIYRIVEALEVVELSPAVMRRASQPLPAPLGTLDAMHLATADLWRESRAKEPIIATHDKALGLAARATGFKVLGC
ncbi:MAG: type II toxin-antitoxin system VapC family toxin [Gemmatimonadota bacterium]